jgi:hypothetical protein
MKYHGSCQCGKVKFEAKGEIESVMSCNCSICSKRATLLWPIPIKSFKLLTPETELSTYTFNTHKIKHQFCKTCGCAPFSKGINPKGESIVAINARCLDDFDVTEAKVNLFNGRAL